MAHTPMPATAIEDVFRGFGQRRAALDYAFFKLNLPEHRVGLLVDFIVRRRRGIAQVRVSAHAPGESGVSFAEMPLDRLVSGAMSSPEPGVSIGENWLGAAGSRGAVGNTAWDLAFQPVGAALHPQIKLIEPLRPFDLSLQSVPDVRFTGTLRVGEQRYEARAARGMVSAYFGRALPERWYWISCNSFDRDDLALECIVSRMALFGGPARLQVAYFSFATAQRRETIIAPINGTIRAEGTREALTITARPRGGKAGYTLRCSAAAGDFHDLGDRIQTTLLGSCTLEGIATARGTAGIEERQPGRD